MKKLFILLFTLPILTTVHAQYSKINNTYESPYFLEVYPGGIRTKPCLRYFYIHTKEANVQVKIFEYPDSRYKNGQLIDSLCTDNTGFKKTKTIQFSGGVHYLKYIAYAHNKEYMQKEKLHIKKNCK